MRLLPNMGAAIALAALFPSTGAAVPLDYLPSLKGDYFRIQSKAVGRPYHIYVRLPED